MNRGLFVTGIDTGVGKTVVAAALLHAYRASGRRAVGMKPVASGCTREAAGWRNEDALLLQAASDPRPDYELVNPYALPEPTAPQIAAKHAGVHVELQPMVSAYVALVAQSDIVVVEGVGGWLAPLADGLDQSDLARACDIEDVVLVVGLRLGCLNHARLSERAIATEGFRLAGWIGNAIDDRLDHADAYFETVRSALSVPCLGRLAYRPNADPADLARQLRLPG